MFSITTNRYTIWCTPKGEFRDYNTYRSHAELVEEFDIRNQNGQIMGHFELDIMQADICTIAVQTYEQWPFLVVAQSYRHTQAFPPGALIIPDTNILFIGAGTRLLCYDLENIRRLWEDITNIGFQKWEIRDGLVIMSAEAELAVWNTLGHKQWSMFVEPPWSYKVANDILYVDVMGKISSFPIATGPYT